MGEKNKFYTMKNKIILIISTFIFSTSCQPETKHDRDANTSFSPTVNKVQPTTQVQKPDTSPDDKQMLLYMGNLFYKRNTDLCKVFNDLRNIEDMSIRQADLKYPDFGEKHGDYQSKLYNQEYKKLLKTLKIHDSLIYHINAYGVRYCANN